MPASSLNIAGTLTYDTAGSGRPAVLFLHAWACDRRMWDRQQPVFAREGYRVLRCDLRGHGISPAAQPGRTDADDVVELLHTVASDGAVIVGASFGARVAQDVALRAPDLVRALVLISPGTFGRPPSPELRDFAQREQKLLTAGDLDAAARLNTETFLARGTDEAVATALYHQLRASFARWLAAGASTTARPVSVDPSRITAPALIISGGQDLDYFRDVNPAEQVPGARHICLDWAGHLPNLERPGEMNQLMLDFVRAAAPASDRPGE